MYVSRSPAWIADVTLDANFPKARLAQDIGVNAVFALPVLVGEEVITVHEFFAPEASPPNAEVPEVSAHVGTLLERGVER